MAAMSYNLAFWAGGDDLDPLTTYTALNSGEHVEGVRAVDVAVLEDALSSQLKGWRRDANILQPPDAQPDAGPAFDLSIGAQLVEFIGYGTGGDHYNAIIDVMRPLGFRLFDPQAVERFD